MVDYGIWLSWNEYEDACLNDMGWKEPFFFFNDFQISNENCYILLWFITCILFKSLLSQALYIVQWNEWVNILISNEMEREFFPLIFRYHLEIVVFCCNQKLTVFLNLKLCFAAWKLLVMRLHCNWINTEIYEILWWQRMFFSWF